MPSKTAKPSRLKPAEKAPARRIAIVAFPGVTLLDISGPAQVFAELEAIEPEHPQAPLRQVPAGGRAHRADTGHDHVVWR